MSANPLPRPTCSQCGRAVELTAQGRCENEYACTRYFIRFGPRKPAEPLLDPNVCPCDGCQIKATQERKWFGYGDRDFIR
jgi:hypothetical protein